MSEEPGAHPRVRDLLRDPVFGSYVISRFTGGTAVKLLQATLLWQVYAITDSELALAVVGGVQFLPALALALVGGAVADAYDRRRISQWAHGVAALVAVGLFLLALRPDPTPALIYLFAAGISIADSFERPAAVALLPQLVSREALPRAVIVNSVSRTLAFMTGPVVSGLTIAYAGVPTAYALYVALIVVSMLLLIPARPRRDRTGAKTRVSWASIRDGLDFVRGHPIVLGCMTLDLFAVIFGGAVALLPVYAETILGVGAKGYGVLSAGAEIGAVLMALFFLLRRPIERGGRTLLLGVTGFAVATVVFGFSRSFALSFAAYVAVGMFDYLSVVMRSTLVQLETPDEKRGRVSAVNMLFVSSSNQLAAVESGVVAHFTSPTFAVVSGGCAALVVVAWVAWKIPALWRYRLDRDVGDAR